MTPEPTLNAHNKDEFPPAHTAEPYTGDTDVISLIESDFEKR